MSENIVIGDVRPRIQAVGDGVQTSFTYPFPIFQEKDLEVYLDEVLQDSGYTVSGVGQSAGGTVDFATAPAANVVVTLRRYLKIERTSDFAEGGAFHAAVINQELDYLVAVAQQNEVQFERSLQLDPTDSDVQLVLPSKKQRSNASLVFDDDGVPMVGPSVNDIAQAQANSETAVQAAEMATVEAQAADAARLSAEAAAESIQTFDPALYRPKSVLIETNDLAEKTVTTATIQDAAITQDKIDPSVQLGGPGIGDTGFRVNDTNVTSDQTLWSLNTVFTVDIATNSLSVGSDQRFKNGDVVYLETDGNLPVGLETDMPYRVVNVSSAALQLSETFDGGVIDITDGGTGNHTIYKAINVNAAGPIQVESGVTVTVKSGCTWRVV